MPLFINATRDDGASRRPLARAVGTDEGRTSTGDSLRGRAMAPEVQRQLLAAALGEDSLPAPGEPTSTLWRRYVSTQDNLARGHIPAPSPISGASGQPTDLGAIRVKRMGEGLRLSLVSEREGGLLSLRHGGVARQRIPNGKAVWVRGGGPLAVRMSHDGERIVVRDRADGHYKLHCEAPLWPAAGHDDSQWRPPPEGEPIAAGEVAGLMGTRPQPSMPAVRMLAGADPGLTVRSPLDDSTLYARTEGSVGDGPSPTMFSALLFGPVAGADTWCRAPGSETTSSLWWWQPSAPPVRCSAPAGPTLLPKDGDPVDFAHTTLLRLAVSANQDWQLDEGDDVVLVRKARSPDKLAVWVQNHHHQNADPPSLKLQHAPRRLVSSRDGNQLAILDAVGKVSSWDLSGWPATSRHISSGGQMPMPQRLALSPDGLSLALAFAPQRGRAPDVEIWALDGDTPVRQGPAASTQRPSLASWFLRPPRLTDFAFTDCGTRLLAVTNSPAAWLWDLAAE